MTIKSDTFVHLPAIRCFCFTFIFWFLQSLSVFAAGSNPNDSFDNRLSLRGGELEFTVSNVGATREAGEPRHAGQDGGGSLWWLWRAPEEGYVEIDTEGSRIDTLLGVYFGKDVRSLSAFASNDDFGTNRFSKVTFDADLRNDYAIAVDGKRGGFGDIRLRLKLYTFPVVTKPPGTLEVADGETAIFTVDALGKRPLSYQWQRFGTNLPGESGASLRIAAATKAFGGAYRVIVSNSYGSVTSTPPAVLQVVERPKISQHPANAQREDGDDVSFVVRAFGEAPLRYQWEFRSPQATEYKALLVPPVPDLVLTNLSTDEIGFYRVRVSNAYGEAVSDAANLNVLADRPRILEALTNRTVVEVTNVTFLAKIRGNRPMNVEWYWDGVPIAGQIRTNFDIPEARTNASGLYRFQVWNRYGTNTSQNARLTVEPRPPNDLFTNRIDLSFETNTVFGFNKNGMAETGEPVHVGQTPRRSVWWTYAATNRGVVTVDLAGSTIDTLLSVYKGTNLTRLKRVVDNDDYSDLFSGGVRKQSKASFVVEPGEEYPFAVEGKGNEQADWNGNSGRGGLAVKVSFNPDFGAPFLLGNLSGFMFMLGSLDGAGGCRDTEMSLQADSLVPFGYRWQFNLRCPDPARLLANTGGVAIPPELAPLLSGVQRTWLGVDCTAGDTWVNIPGATNSRLVLNKLHMGHSGQYRLIAQNIGAAGSVTSSPSILVVSPVPTISQNLPARLDAKDCETRKLEFKTDGGCYPATYEWYRDGLKLAAATNATLTFTNGSPELNGNYLGVARGPYGASTSSVCVVTFDARPVIRTQPVGLSQPAKDCDALVLSTAVVPTCRSAQVQWQRNGVDIPGATTFTYLFRATAETAGDYRARVYNEYASVLTQVAKIPVEANPFIQKHPDTDKPRRVLAGTTFTNQVLAQSCSDLTFEWRRNGVPLVLDSRIGSTQRLVDAERSIVSSELVIDRADPADSGRYDVVVRSGSGTSTSRSGIIEVLYRPPNDDFAQRFPLVTTTSVDRKTNVFSGSTRGTNLLATAEPKEPDHARQPARRSVWWTWEAPGPCEVTLDTVGSDFDTLLAVYRGDDLAALTRVSEDDQSGGNGASRAKFLAARGRRLHFAVDGSNGAEGYVRLSLSAREIISPPIILQQPRSIAVTNGATADFSVETYGSPDILYQWFFNAEPIPGATNSSLRINNVQARHEGNYTVNMRNDFGETNSMIARLTFGIIIEGQVTDATNRRGVPNALVSVGDISTYTDTNGNYSLVGVRPGEANADFDAKKRIVRIKEPVFFNNRTTLRTLHFHAEKPPEYFDYDDLQFEAKLGQTVTNKFSMTPVFTGFRFVVNWGLEPADLDAHLLTPPIQGTSYHVQYPQANRGRRDGPPFATLDYDVQDSYGPETLTLYQLEDGVYRFFIKQFDPRARGSLTASKATVKIYTRGVIPGEDGLYGTRSVPVTGNGTVWHVCDIDGRRNSVTWADQILSGDPLPAQPNKVSSNEITLPSSSYYISALQNDGRSVSKSEKNAAAFPGVKFFWEFGDGSSSSEVEPVHPYRAPGQYTVKLSLFKESLSGQLLDREIKTNFITVYNEEPIVKLLTPPNGKLFKLGERISVTADASDIDGDVRRVEFLRVANGRTNLLGVVTNAPYKYDFQTQEEGSITFVARAVDDFDGIRISSPVTIKVLDVDGDVLIVRNFDHPEINKMVEWLNAIKVPTEDGTTRDLVVRVLDQEGIYLDLIRHFRLIVWDDLGETKNGLMDEDVRLFNEAHQSGIALYLMGDRLASSSFNLGTELGVWSDLTQLKPSLDRAEAAVILPVKERPRHEFFGQRYGDVKSFIYSGDLIEKWSLSNGNVDISATMDSRAIMMRSPRFGEPDFGEPRRVIQGFRVARGDDEVSLAERRKLFLNTSAWLLRLTECRNFGGFVSCYEPPIGAKIGEPVSFDILVTQNGECTVGGVLITNRLAANLELQTYEIFAESGRADTNTVRVERDGNGVVWRLGQLPSAGSFTIRLTAIPRKGGLLTNYHGLSFGILSRQPCVQVMNVEGLTCELPTKISAAIEADGRIYLTILGQGGCSGSLEVSTDLQRWTAAQTFTLDPQGSAKLFENIGDGTQIFYRVVIR
jgi:PKD repeat protein